MKVFLTAILFLGLCSFSYADDAIEYIQNTSVTIKSGTSEGSGNIITRKVETEEGKVEIVNFILTAGHVVDDLRKVREIVDTDGTSKKVVEFDNASIVKEFRQNGRRVGETKLDAKVVKYSDSENGEDIAVLMVLMYNFSEDGVEFYLDENIPAVGTELIHCGSLLGQMGANSLTTGIMSQIGRVYKGTIYDQTTVTAFPGSCLPMNTMISMANGTIKPITQVKKGDTVLCYGNVSKQLCRSVGNYNLRPVRSGTVLDVINAGEKEIFEIKTRNRTLKASGNHPVIKINSILDMSNKIINVPTWCRVDELKEHDVIATLKHHIPFRKSAAFNFSKEIGQDKDPCELMRLLGFYVGDGYKRYRQEQGGELCLYTFDDHDTDFYKNIVYNIFGKNPTVVDDNYLRVSSVDIVNKLSDWGFDGLAHTKSIPDWVFQCTPDQQMAFLQGYVDADGHVNNSNHWQLECCNKNLIIQLRAMAMNLGLGISNISSRTRQANIDGRTINSTESWCCEIYPDPQTQGAQITGNTDLVPQDLRYERIASITKTGTEPTFDLSIDSYHNFFAEGVLVHNSGGGVFIKQNNQAKYVGMVVRGSGETFNLMVPVRRLVTWAKHNNVEWIVNHQLDVPTLEEIKKLPIEAGYKDIKDRSKSTNTEEEKQEWKFMDGEHNQSYIVLPRN